MTPTGTEALIEEWACANAVSKHLQRPDKLVRKREYWEIGYDISFGMRTQVMVLTI